MTSCWIIVFLTLFCQQQTGHQVNSEHFYQRGKFNIAVFQSLHRQSDEDSSNCHGPISRSAFSLTEVVRHTIRRINRDSHLLPNVPLGFVIIDSCQSQRRTLHQAVQHLKAAWDTGGVQKPWPSDHSPTKIEQEPPRFLRRMESFTQVPVIGVVGGQTNQAAEILSTYLQLYRIPIVTLATVSDRLANPRRHPYLFRLVPSADRLGEVLSRVLRHFHWVYVGVLYDAESVTRDIVVQMEKRMRQFDLCFALRESVPLAATQEYFEIIIKRLLNYFQNGRVVVLLLNHQNAHTFIKALNRLDLVQRFILVWTDTVYSLTPEFYKASPNGLWLTSYLEHSDMQRTYLNLTYSSLAGNPWASQFWKRLYNCQMNYRSARWCSKYTSKPIGESLKHAGLPALFDQRAFVLEVAVETFAKALHNAITVYCPLYFSARHRIDQHQDCIKSDTMVAALRSLNLYVNNALGKSLHFQFDHTGQLVTSEIQINQIQSNKTLKPIGYYYADIDHLEIQDNKTTWIQKGKPIPESVCGIPCRQTEAIIWQSACCWTCFSCPQGKVLSVNRSHCLPCPETQWNPLLSSTSTLSELNTTIDMLTSKAAGYSNRCATIARLNFSHFHLATSVNAILSVIGMTFCLPLAICLAKWRHRKAIRTTGFWSHLCILLALTLLFGHTFVYLLPPTNVHCVFIMMSLPLLFTTVYALLLSHSLRVYLECRRRSPQLWQHPRRIREADAPVYAQSASVHTALDIFLILLQVLLVTTVYTLHDGPHTTSSLISSDSTPIMERHCVDTPLTLHLPAAYHTLILLLATILTYRAYRLNPPTRQALILVVTNCLSLLFWTLFFVVYEAFTTRPWQRTFLRLVLVHSATIIVLVGVFMIKLCSIALGHHENSITGSIGNTELSVGHRALVSMDNNTTGRSSSTSGAVSSRPLECHHNQAAAIPERMSSTSEDEGMPSDMDLYRSTLPRCCPPPGAGLGMDGRPGCLLLFPRSRGGATGLTKMTVPMVTSRRLSERDSGFSMSEETMSMRVHQSAHNGESIL